MGGYMTLGGYGVGLRIRGPYRTPEPYRNPVTPRNRNRTVTRTVTRNLNANSTSDDALRGSKSWSAGLVPKLVPRLSVA
jgi:hypothetical protein